MTPGRSATAALPPPLPRAFYERDPVLVARELLGALLVRREPGSDAVLAGRIVETEAYLQTYRGEPDRAAHAWRGMTPRTRVLFGPGGHAYVYLIYGVHECLNVSAERDGEPGCVLIRALEPVSGMAKMMRARPTARGEAARLCAGPGNLTRALAITRAHNGVDLTDPGSALSIRTGGGRAVRVGVSGRIGIRHGADWPLRFYILDNKSISRAT